MILFAFLIGGWFGLFVAVLMFMARDDDDDK